MAGAFGNLHRHQPDTDDFTGETAGSEDATMAETAVLTADFVGLPPDTRAEDVPDNVASGVDLGGLQGSSVSFAVPAWTEGAFAEPGSTHTLLLALFLVVLAFFIVMVSYSTIDGRRSEAIMGSLTSTFAAHRNGLSKPYALGTAEGEVVAIREMEAQLAKLFATRLRIAEVEITRVGRSMELAMPTEALFRRGSEELRQSRLPLLDRIVATVSQRLAATPYSLALRLASVDGVNGGSPFTPDSLILRRAGTIARAMVERGLPADAIAVAIESASTDKIVFAIRITHDEPPETPARRWSTEQG